MDISLRNAVDLTIQSAQRVFARQRTLIPIGDIWVVSFTSALSKREMRKISKRLYRYHPIKESIQFIQMGYIHWVMEFPRGTQEEEASAFAQDFLAIERLSGW